MSFTDTYMVLSTDYLEAPVAATSAVIPFLYWERITEEIDTPRLFANITFRNGSRRICSVNSFDLPAGQVHPKVIYLPQWMIPHDEAYGNEYEIQFIGKDSFPSALKITLRPIDSAFYNVDAKEELEASLSAMGVLQQGDQITLPMNALGGYEVSFYISELMPADIVLLDGEEVAIDFEEAVDQFDGRTSTEERPATPIPDEMVSFDFSSPQGGNILGGTVRRTADGKAWNPWRV
jgi:hypothetical protein